MSIDWHGITKNKEERWNYPYINPDTGTWWEWSAEQNAYVNTEINALGYTGETGEQGERGPKGDPGTSVYVTSITPSSVDGGGNVVTFSDGTSMTVYNGSTGTAGPAGRDGVDGLPGAAGSTGPQGPKGDPGIPGTGVTVVDVSESEVDGGANIVTFSDGTTMSVLNGNKGSQGPRGFQGERGEQGLKGDKGDKGDPGSAAEGVVTVPDNMKVAIVYDNDLSTPGIKTSIGSYHLLSYWLLSTERLAPTFSKNTSYTAGQFVVYNSVLYQFTQDHPAGNWNSSHAQMHLISDFLHKEEVVQIDESAPAITGKDNTRYVCGTVTSISITPPESGTIDVVFTSGSPEATLTLPNTVKMPSWFDATALETGTVYEIMITDGIYGVVTSWTA